jgi:hypothetical protein
VAARAGFACQVTLVDDDSVDLIIGARGYVHAQAVVRSPRIEVQLKATAKEVLAESAVVFPLPLKNYEELRLPSALPRILVVLRVPEPIGNWLQQSEDEMVMRHGAYWHSLAGMKESDNTTSVTVELPRANLLTPDSLTKLMERASRREPL